MSSVAYHIFLASQGNGTVMIFDDIRNKEGRRG